MKAWLSVPPFHLKNRNVYRPLLRKLNIINLYVPPGRSFSRKELEKILSHQDTIIFGDMNAHSPVFGARHSYRKGKIMENLTLTLNLVILNTGGDIHLATNGSVSPINISLASPNWATKATWKILSKSLGSDHNIMQMIVNDKVLHEDLGLPRVNLKTLNGGLISGNVSFNYYSGTAIGNP